MEYVYKEVDFYRYCRDCKYQGTAEGDDPCHRCLDEPVNLHSKKPVYFEPKKGGTRHVFN